MQAPAEEPVKLEPMKLGKAEFKIGGGATEFIPKNKMVATKEQFPDLDALDDNLSKPVKKDKKKK